MTPEQMAAEAQEKCQAAIQRHVDRASGKPQDEAYYASVRQLRQELDEIIASYPPGMVGRFTLT